MHNLFASNSWYLKVLVFVLAPVVVLVFLCLIAVAMCLCFDSLNYLGERRFRAQMRRKQRFLPKLTACERIEAEGGTLIIDTPTIGWSHTHAWWTPDDISSSLKFSEPTFEDYKDAAEARRCLDWDRWFWENYICPDHGKALLLCVWSGRSFVEELTERYPNLPVVRTWSGWIQRQQWLDQRESDTYKRR